MHDAQIDQLPHIWTLQRTIHDRAKWCGRHRFSAAYSYGVAMGYWDHRIKTGGSPDAVVADELEDFISMMTMGEM